MSTTDDSRQQLALLDLPPVEDASQPLPFAQPNHRQAIAWHTARAELYLRLMNRFLNGNRCSQEVRRHEISRLHSLRQQALAAIKELGG